MVMKANDFWDFFFLKLLFFAVIFSFVLLFFLCVFNVNF